MNNKTKIVILGGGFGGVYTALRLDRRLRRRARRQDRRPAAADSAARTAASPARSEEHRGGSRRASEKVLPLLHHWPARVDRPPARRCEHPRHELLRLRRLVAVALRLPAQASAAGEEDARGALLVAGHDLLEGPRADANPSGRRVDLTHRDVTAPRCHQMKYNRRLKDVEKNSSERCLVN
jgi:glycine/D-amino acid oxidase-like deaminating enzyme